MARLPQPGSDTGNWGSILNDFLAQSLDNDGTIKPGAVDAVAITDNTITESKLDAGVQAKLNSAAGVSSVAGKTGAVTLVKADVGLTNVDDTSDANKPISNATQTALNAKAATSSLSTVATSGSYADLTNQPTIPRITASLTAPVSPQTGDIWIDLSV